MRDEATSPSRSPGSRHRAPAAAATGLGGVEEKGWARMKTYRGDRTIDGLDVTVDGEPLDEAFKVKTLCADGFEWSYDGAGPAQLALAILVNHFGDADRALRDHAVFSERVVANFNNEWEMTSHDIDRALSNIAATQ